MESTNKMMSSEESVLDGITDLNNTSDETNEYDRRLERFQSSNRETDQVMRRLSNGFEQIGFSAGVDFRLEDTAWTTGPRMDGPSNGNTAPKRPILKSSAKSYDAELIHTSAPNDQHFDWYRSFAAETKRVPNEGHKRVQWTDIRPVGPIRRPSGDSLLPTRNGFNSDDNISAKNRSESTPQTNGWNWPKVELGSSTSIVDSILGPAAENCRAEDIYFRDHWKRNIDIWCSNLVSRPRSSDSWNDPMTSIWSNTTDSVSGRPPDRPNDAKTKLEAFMAQMRQKGVKADPNYTWSGQLPRRLRTKNPIYSCKVFLGGIPYDLTDSDLHCTFAQYGHIQIQWPGKDIRSAIDGATANKAGYVYIIFESYDNVAALLHSCTVSYRDTDVGCRWYYEISSRRQRAKEVQVIPFDIGDRFYMKSTFCGQMEHSRTVFVGALHGMLTADGLAKVMDDLFGGVIFAGLDTDKHKYPLGSGRVSFDNQDSYLKAVSAAFVEIKAHRFKKKIQIDPYIENESVCAVCHVQQQSPVFCRDDMLYFCHNCWDAHHSDPESAKHRPLVKNKATNA